MQFILLFTFAAVFASVRNIREQNAKLRQTNAALLKALKELAVGDLLDSNSEVQTAESDLYKEAKADFWESQSRVGSRKKETAVSDGESAVGVTDMCVECDCRYYDGDTGTYSSCKRASRAACRNYCVRCEQDGVTPMSGFWTNHNQACLDYTNDCWDESTDGTDLAPGEWEGTGGTTYAQCQARAMDAHSMYFAWTDQVYQPGYCKVLKSGVLSPNLNTHQGYGYKLYENQCREIESEVGGKEDCISPPATTCELCEGIKDYCSGQKYVVKTYPLEDVQYSGLFGCSYPMTPIYVSSCDCWDNWDESTDGTDLAPGEWEGTGGTTYDQCQARAKAAHSMYFAWTDQVYQPGYCKVLKSGVLSPNLNTHQGYGYKLYANTCRQIESAIGAPRQHTGPRYKGCFHMGDNMIENREVEDPKECRKMCRKQRSIYFGLQEKMCSCSKPMSQRDSHMTKADDDDCYSDRTVPVGRSQSSISIYTTTDYVQYEASPRTSDICIELCRTGEAGSLCTCDTQPPAKSLTMGPEVYEVVGLSGRFITLFAIVGAISIVLHAASFIRNKYIRAGFTPIEGEC